MRNQELRQERIITVVRTVKQMAEGVKLYSINIGTVIEQESC